MSDSDSNKTGSDTSIRASRRTVIKGVIASGIAVSAAGYIVYDRFGSRGSVSGAVERLVTLNVNGRERRVDVLPQETLAHTVRYKLGLTGTKIGCDHSECGACSVMVDDVSTYSCSTLTHSVRGRKITTIEGIEGPNGELHKVQKAMITELGQARTHEEFISAVQALDRILTAGRYVIPVSYSRISRLAHRADLDYPEMTPLYGDWPGFMPETWWQEERK